MLEKSFGLLYYLKQAKNPKETDRYVYLRITVNGAYRDVSIKRQWDTSRWNAEIGRATGVKDDAKETGNRPRDDAGIAQHRRGRQHEDTQRKEREILELFFGLKHQHAHSLEELGEKFGLTRERVRQIKDRALARLRDSRHTAPLRSYLGD